MVENEKFEETRELIYAAIEHVARANWTGREAEARRMADDALNALITAVRAEVSNG